MVVDVQKTVVHPVPRKGAAVGTFALGDLVFVVREDQILAACVDIDGLAQMPARHGAALNVPARTSLAVGAVPVRFARLRGLPHGKIRGVLFQIAVHLAAKRAVAAFKVLQHQMGKLAVFLEFLSAEIHVAVFGHIAVAFFNDVRHDGQYLVDVLRGAGAHRGRQCVQTVAIL